MFPPGIPGIIAPGIFSAVDISSSGYALCIFTCVLTCLTCSFIVCLSLP